MAVKLADAVANFFWWDGEPSSRLRIASRTGKSRVATMRRALQVLAAIAIVSAAQAHDWWGNGEEVDQATKNLCCGPNDCEEVPAKDVIEPGADHRWRFRDTRFAIDASRAMPSPDGRYWRCIWNGEIKCFFAPSRID